MLHPADFIYRASAPVAAAKIRGRAQHSGQDDGDQATVFGCYAAVAMTDCR